MSDFDGIYHLEKSEGFDDYMKELKVNIVTRKLADAAKPVTTITTNGDQITITTDMLFKKSSITFKLGEEFDEDRSDGTKCKSIVTREGNKLIHKQKAISGGIDSFNTREFTNNQMIMVLKAGNVTCTRVYKKE